MADLLLVASILKQFSSSIYEEFMSRISSYCSLSSDDCIDIFKESLSAACDEFGLKLSFSKPVSN